jgi:small conductance mechanosensitive channel
MLPSELDPPKTLPDQVRRVGEYETAPIYSPLDGRELFEVTSPTVLDRSKIAENEFPVELRAQAVGSAPDMLLSSK